MLTLQGIAALGQLALSGYSMFRKAPKRPKFPNYDETGIGEADLARMREMITRRRYQSRDATLRDASANLAARGLGRSGLRGQVEGQIRSDAESDISDSLLNLDLKNLDLKNAWRERKLNFDQLNYLAEQGDYGGLQSAAGQNLQNIDFEALFKLFKKRQVTGAV